MGCFGWGEEKSGKDKQQIQRLAIIALKRKEIKITMRLIKTTNMKNIFWQFNLHLDLSNGERCGFVAEAAQPGRHHSTNPAIQQQSPAKQKCLFAGEETAQFGPFADEKVQKQQRHVSFIARGRRE